MMIGAGSHLVGIMVKVVLVLVESLELIGTAGTQTHLQLPLQRKRSRMMIGGLGDELVSGGCLKTSIIMFKFGKAIVCLSALAGCRSIK